MSFNPGTVSIVMMNTYTLQTTEADILYDVRGPLPAAGGRPPLFMIGQPMCGQRLRHAGRTSARASQPPPPPAPARPPCRRPLPGPDPAPARPRRPPQRIQAGSLEAHGNTSGRVLEPHR